MFKMSKISAYCKASKYVNNFNKGDYVLYYHKGWGIIDAGIVKNNLVKKNEEKREL